jgi:hypothetical protein
LLFFSRFTAAQRELPEVRRGWLHLFRRFRIRKVTDFERYGLPLPADAEWFAQLLRRREPRWLAMAKRLRDPKLLALKAFYRVYPHVPAFIRLPLKRAAKSLGYLRERP